MLAQEGASGRLAVWLHPSALRGSVARGRGWEGLLQHCEVGSVGVLMTAGRGSFLHLWGPVAQ